MRSIQIGVGILSILISAFAVRARQDTTSSQTTTQPQHASARQRPLGDYVPCMFDEGEIYDLRSLETPDTRKLPKNVKLDHDAAQFVADTLKSSLNALPETKKPDKVFTDTLNPELFEGLLPAQIPARVTSKAEEYTKKSGGENSKVIPSISAITTTADTVVTSITGPQFNRPDDVSCSFSFLQWRETSDNFGRRVANDYVAIQVTVRNLNKTSEFLLHDVQIAVDTGLNREQFGRFEAARDKLIVRNVAQRGQSDDRRNLIINTLQAAGAIAGGASTAVGQSQTSQLATNLASGVSIFQGPFMTGVVNIFPDHTIEHINHINDLAFSASSSSKTIVPILGSVPLVTFLSEKPLEQLPFSHCGAAVKKKSHRQTSVEAAEDDSNPGSLLYPFCNIDAQTAGGSTTEPQYYMKNFPFRNWNAAALRILERHTFVVIGGVHIQEIPNNPQVTKLSCPTLPDNTIDLSKVASDGSITCTLQGTHLDKAASIKLEQGSIVKTGSLKAATDGTSATIAFKATDFSFASGKYELFLSDSSGVDIDTQQALYFLVRKPDITNVAFSPATLSAVTTAGLTATLTGTNLDRIQSVELDCCSGTSIKGAIAAKASPNDKTMSVTFTKEGVTTLSTALSQAPANSAAQLKFATVEEPNTLITPSNGVIH